MDHRKERDRGHRSPPAGIIYGFPPLTDLLNTDYFLLISGSRLPLRHALITGAGATQVLPGVYAGPVTVAPLKSEGVAAGHRHLFQVQPLVGRVAHHQGLAGVPIFS